MEQRDYRKYITETDILDKEARIDLILEMLRMIISDGINPRLAVSLVGLQTKIPEEQLIRLLPEEIVAKFKADTLD